MLIHTERTDSGQVAMLRLRNPPVNSLSAALRAELHAAIQAALADEGVRALVLAGDGGFFCCGAEIREFNTPMSTREPTLRSVIALIEGAAKPVVAAIHGAALGGGLELALGCHYRVALEGASLGLPEVKLGVLPGAGGTQRLPRIVGVERALTMIAQGDAIDTSTALDWGLLDEVFADDLPQRAAAYALAHAEAPLAGRNVGARKVAALSDPGVYDRARAEVARRYRGCVAPLACVDCVEAAANTALQDGLAVERERFLELVNGSQSKAQRHLFFAERAAVSLPLDAVAA